MAMNLTVAGPESRVETTAEETTTLADLLKKQGFNNLAKASVMMDGTTLGSDALTKSLKDIGAINGSTIAVCIKLQNA